MMKVRGKVGSPSSLLLHWRGQTASLSVVEPFLNVEKQDRGKQRREKYVFGRLICRE
jgi:hypothetical protein